ncbi:hypothetical protein F240042I4_00180 [Eisenbergiella tayi]
MACGGGRRRVIRQKLVRSQRLVSRQMRVRKQMGIPGKRKGGWFYGSKTDRKI